MNKRLVFSLFVFVLIFSLPLNGFTQKKNLTYKQVFVRKRLSLYKSLPRLSGWLDDKYYLENKTIEKHQQVLKVDAKSGDATIYIDYSELNKLLPEGFTLTRRDTISEDLNHYILEKDNHLFYFNRETKEFKQVTYSDSKEKNPTFSPDGKKIAFTRENDLYFVDLTSAKETRLTTDGSDVVYNGWASWVYYEEILGRRSRYKAFWWSPDSKMIAYLRFDDTTVPEFPIFNADGTHGSLEIMHYPKSGDPNPLVKLGIAHLNTGEIVWMETNEEKDRYVAWPFWTSDSMELVYQYMNRDQNKIIFYASNPHTGSIRKIYTEEQHSWVEFFEDVYVFEDGSGFLLRSDKNGWRNLYYYNWQGNMISQVTNFDWRVTGISRVVEKTKTVFFTGTGGTSTENHLFSIRLNGKNLKQLTEIGGTHKVNVSPGGKYYYDTYSNIELPSQMGLYNRDGKQVRFLGDSKKPEMDEFNWGKTELFTIPTEDGYDLPAIWVLPPDFDQSKQYPVRFTIYGGPGSPSVRNSIPYSFSAQYYAQNGIITFIVDHRGTGHFGKKGVELMHRNLGKWEMHDYIEAVKWLRDKPFIDHDRIGICGGSYGGYMTCMALTYGADYFTHGIAGSSVTDWKLYDNVYTERYMDTPEQNPAGYKNGSALTWAGQYKGKLLITHGTADDNVHMQNTIQFIDLMEDLGKDFDLMLYPNERHGIRGKKRSHVSREQAKFWFRHFLGKELNTEE